MRLSGRRYREGQVFGQESSAFSALAELEAADGSEDKPAREEAEQERHDLDADAGHHCPLVRHQPAIGLLGDGSGQNLENGRIETGPEPGARLELRRHRTGQSTVTRTPCGASSARIASVNDST